VARPESFPRRALVLAMRERLPSFISVAFGTKGL
jgi:hypothetical protein